MLRLLCVTAHPDDEAGGFGGSLLLARERGIETYIICLTPGQAARNRGGADNDGELAAMRRREFAAACEHLHATRGFVLDYPDSRLDQQSLYQVCGDLARRIRQLKPQVVMSFGPEGSLTAHPDHSMAGIYATMAFQWAARPTRYPEQLQDGMKPWRAQKLYYRSSDFMLPERPPIALSPVSARIEIGVERMERKIEAFKMHTSQGPLFSLFEGNARRHGTVERFHLAASVKPQEVRFEDDLFAGVEDEG
jgi:LmbE family N-acetylglucosaminyl deacetylase